MSRGPADSNFLDDYLKDVCPGGAAQIPANTFLLGPAGAGARDVACP